MVEEVHNGEKLFITRKGAVRAQAGDLGIIPGSMGVKTFIVEGLGSEDSFTSCSHGAGRTMSRTAAKKAFTVEDHVLATEGVECDKTEDTLDETPGAYKNIDDVMAAQSDLVRPLYTLKQFLCVKGKSEGKRWEKKKKKGAEA
jgi:tRNA-splicing ligase RtcB